MTKKKRFLARLYILLLVFISLFSSYLFLNVNGVLLTNDTIITGNWNSVKIGDDKYSVSKYISNELKSNICLDYRYYLKGRVGPLEDFDLIKFETIVTPQDSWKFYFDCKTNDSVEFQFDEGVLVKVRRYRNNFELP